MGNFIADLKSGKLHRQYHFGADFEGNGHEEKEEETEETDTEGVPNNQDSEENGEPIVSFRSILLRCNSN